MFTKSIIIACALCGQAPNPDTVASPERQRELLAAIQARKAPAPTAERPRYDVADRAAQLRAVRAIRQARYAARNDQTNREWAAQVEMQRRIAEEQRRRHLQELPFLLENQRQMLERQTQLERNQILNRALNGTSYVPAVPLNPRP